MSRFALNKIWVKTTPKRVKKTSADPWHQYTSNGGCLFTVRNVDYSLLFRLLFAYILRYISLYCFAHCIIVAPHAYFIAAFLILFSCKSREEKKTWRRLAAWLYSAAWRFVGSLIFRGLWHHWALVWVCVCFFEVFSLRLFFPLLAVNVVVRPIIYLFVGVVCVLANSFTNMFNLWFYICEYKVNAYQ